MVEDIGQIGHQVEAEVATMVEAAVHLRVQPEAVAQVIYLDIMDVIHYMKRVYLQIWFFLVAHIIIVDIILQIQT